MPREFAVAVCVLGVTHGIGDVVHVAGEWVTHETVCPIEVPVGIARQGQRRGRSGHVVATGTARLAGLVTGLKDTCAVGVTGPAHSVRDIVEITGVP